MATQQSLQSFLDELASGQPTPGGGGAAATVGAMGAALVSMVCNLTIGKKKFAEVEAQMQDILAQAQALQTQLGQLIAEDSEAFDDVMAAFRLPKETEAQQKVRSAAIQAASKKATLVPLVTAQACAQVIELCQTAARLGNPNVLSDAGAGVLCAQAGLKAAALNVLINLGTLKDKDFVARHRSELDQLLDRHEALGQQVYDQVKQEIES